MLNIQERLCVTPQKNPVFCAKISKKTAQAVSAVCIAASSAIGKDLITDSKNTKKTSISADIYSDEEFLNTLDDLNKEMETNDKCWTTKFQFGKAEKLKMLELLHREPELVTKIFRYQKEVEHMSTFKVCKPDYLEELIELKQKKPDAFNDMNIFDSHGGLICISLLEDFIDAYEINPKLTVELSNMVRYGERRFSRYDEMANVVKDYKNYPELKKAIHAKVIRNGVEEYAYNGAYLGLSSVFRSSSGDKNEKKLVEMTTDDGKYRLFSQEDTCFSFNIDEEVNRILKEEMNTPEEASIAKKKLTILALEKKDSCKTKFYKNKTVLNFLLENIPNNLYSLTINNHYTNDTYELRAESSGTTVTTRFKYDESTNHITIISKEVKKDNGKESTVNTEFSDNRFSKETFHNEEFQNFGYHGKQPVGYEKTVYNKDKGIIYTENFLQSSDIDCSYNISGSGNSGSTEISGNITKISKTLVSNNGTISKSTALYSSKENEFSYKITDKNGDILLDINRKMKEFDKNHFISVINGQKYDLNFDDEIVVSKLDENGNPEETIHFGYNTFDRRLIDLYKKIPGDLFFALHKIGVKGIDLKYSNYYNNNAFFGIAEDNKAHITMSPEMMDNPFSFAHEIGHAIDKLLFKDLNKDKELHKILSQELVEFQQNSSDAEMQILDYFIADNDYANSATQELIAETCAIISGQPDNDRQLALRGVKLQQHFPKTIAYISNKIINKINN